MRAAVQQRGFLKDGRLSGVVARRFLESMTRRIGSGVVSPEALAADVWPDGPPKTWRIILTVTASRINNRLEATAIIRVGSACRLDGFRLDVSQLPNRNVTAVRAVARVRWTWTAAEDRVLREHVGRVTLSELTALVSAVHGRSRTPSAVEGRLYTLGLSKRVKAYSANQLAPILGVSGEVITLWIEAGLIAARRTEPDGLKPDSKRWGWWLIEHAEVEQFLRAYPWEYDWRSMRRGHQLTGVAQVVQRREPYLTLSEFARRQRVSHRTVFRWLTDGRLPGARRITPRSRKASPQLSTWRIPLSAVDSLSMALAQ